MEALAGANAQLRALNPHVRGRLRGELCGEQLVAMDFGMRAERVTSPDDAAMRAVMTRVTGAIVVAMKQCHPDEWDMGD